MDHGKKPCWSFKTGDEDQEIPYSPNHHHLSKSNPRLNVARSTSASMVSQSPSTSSPGGSPWSLSPIHHHHRHTSSPSPSPSSPGGSPWSLSPLHQRSSSHSHSPSLLYHCLATLQRQDGDVFSIALSKGLVFTGSDSDRVRVWKQPECVDRGFVRTRHSGVRALIAHGGTLFTSHKDHKVRIWVITVTDRLRYNKIATLPSGSLLPLHRKRCPQHKDIISCLAYYPPEGLLYTGSWDRTVKVWRLAERRCIDSFIAHEGNINALIVNPDDGCLFTASADGSVKIWRRVFGDSSHILITALRFQPSPVNALALCHAGESCFLYSASSDGSINFWEKEEVVGRYNHGGFLQGHPLAVLCLAAVDRLVFSGSEDTTIRVWRRAEGGALHSCIAVLEGHRGPVRCVAACVEMDKVGMGFLLYSGSLDRMVKVWRIKLMSGESKAAGEVAEGSNGGKEVEYAVSPVLSPSWVERKFQGSKFF